MLTNFFLLRMQLPSCEKDNKTTLVCTAVYNANIHSEWFILTKQATAI